MEKLNNTELTEINWERKLIEKVVLSTLKEQRRSRFWRILLRFITLLFVLFIVLAIIGSVMKDSAATKTPKQEHLALIKIDGEIAADSLVNAENINTALEKAFSNDLVTAVILDINSPGGSPVQSDLINSKIRTLKKKYHKKVYAVAQDLCASGAYYIAVAADEIYVNPSSIVGSVGVIMQGFGFDKAMAKIGVDRRLYTAGENKALLDPFSPEKEDDMQFIRQLLTDTHKQFIKVVKQGRGNKLKIDDQLAFSGLVWSGSAAVANGFADKLGNVDDVAALYPQSSQVHDYTPALTAFDLISKRLGTQVKSALNNRLGLSW